MRTALYTALVLVAATVGGFVLAKNKYLPMQSNNPIEAAVIYERFRSVDMAKNAYALGCLQSFERVCSLLKKGEASRCESYSKSYCNDASVDYSLKLKMIIQGPN